MTYQICVTGENRAGKSTMINTLIGNSGNTVKEMSKNGDYYSSQFKGVQASKVDPSSGATLNFEEIMGSRGRRSNIHALRASIQKADLVIYCTSMLEEGGWGLRSIEYLITTISRTENKKAKLLIVGTKADKKYESFYKDLEALPALAPYTFLETSAVRGDGFDQLLGVIVDEIENGTSVMELSKEMLKAKEEEKLKRERELLKKEQEAKEEKERKEKEEKEKAKAEAKGALAALMGKRSTRGKKTKEEEEVMEIDVAPVA